MEVAPFCMNPKAESDIPHEVASADYRPSRRPGGHAMAYSARCASTLRARKAGRQEKWWSPAPPVPARAVTLVGAKRRPRAR